MLLLIEGQKELRLVERSRNVWDSKYTAPRRDYRGGNVGKRGHEERRHCSFADFPSNSDWIALLLMHE